MKKEIRLSKCASVKANSYGKEFAEAYILVRTLHAIVKHPIILNYKANITATRKLIGYTDKKFRETINNAIRLRLASYSGDNLIFWSNNADKAFKPTKRNDYTSTKTPQRTFEEIIIKNYYNRQHAKVKGKDFQTFNSRTPGEFHYQKRVAPQTSQYINRDITLSSRAMAKLLNGNSPAFGANKKRQHQRSGFINLYPNRVELSKDEAITLIKKRHHNIRFDIKTGTWVYVLADIFDCGNTRTKSYCKKGTKYTEH